MSNRYADAGDALLDLSRHAVDRLNAVVDEEDLSVACQLITNGIGDGLLRPANESCRDWLTIARRRIDIGKVTSTHQGEL